MTKTARRLIADLPAASTPLDGTELVTVEISERKRKVAVADLHDRLSGTWTPVLSDGTNDATHSTQAARYHTLGLGVGPVWINGAVGTSSLGSVSGNIRVKGLPYPHAGGESANGGISVVSSTGLAITSGQVVTGPIVDGNSYIHLQLWDLSTGVSQMQASEWSDDGKIHFFGMYIGDVS
jgi:hypothetical protein